jgi:hypothetical protein
MEISFQSEKLIGSSIVSKILRVSTPKVLLFTMNPFRYKAYGLVIHSEFEVIGLTEASLDETPDVNFVLGKLNVSPYNLIKGFLIKEVTSDGFLYGIKDLASFLISDGTYSARSWVHFCSSGAF